LTVTRLGRPEMRRVTVLLDDDEFALFEKYCDEQGHKKSTLVARLIRDLLEREHVVSQRDLFGDIGTPNERNEGN
jgi:hypothetical protein